MDAWTLIGFQYLFQAQPIGTIQDVHFEDVRCIMYIKYDISRENWKKQRHISAYSENETGYGALIYCES